MKGYSLMDWIQLSGIIGIIASLLSVAGKMFWDTKSLKRDHGDLSSEHKMLSNDHKELKSSQQNILSKLSDHEINRVSAAHKLDKTVTEIMKETNKVSTFLVSEKQREQLKLSLLSYKQQDIQQSLEHLSGLFAELEETNLMNSKLSVERDELEEKVIELEKQIALLQKENQELKKKLALTENKNHCKGLER